MADLKSHKCSDWLRPVTFFNWDRHRLPFLFFTEEDNMLKGELIINKQERKGNYIFNGVMICVTCGFCDTFGEEKQEIVRTALALIQEKYPNNADYLQTFEYHSEDEESVRFWCIHDVDYITFLLPEEY